MKTKQGLLVDRTHSDRGPGPDETHGSSPPGHQQHHPFPASSALGVLTGWRLHHIAPTDAKTILGTGFLGGYSTFSTASVEGARLLVLAAPRQPSSTRAAWRSSALPER